jgi:capsular exopolysaccharide synthesis family protein
VLQEIRRKQSITEGLYLYLLQKREEAAISSTASSIPHYQQIDAATGYGPIEPNRKNILISAALVGFFLAFAFIYLRSLFNDQINSRYELEKLTGLPLLGEVGHISNMKKQLITVLDRTLVSEQFRAIRTNLFFLLKDRNKKVIMVTSTISGEGKSSISLNLAAACAIPGKKVALIEFDMRKPGISNAFNWQNTHGITDYLTGKTKDLSRLYHVSDELPTLHIYTSGLIPENPADVLLDENLQPMFEELRQRYDYIIIDTAPAGMVCDAFVLANYSDAVIYVLRQRLSTKKQVEFLNEADKLKRLNNVVLVLNDVKTGYKYGNNGYGYDTKNGYYHKPSKQVKKDFTWNHREILDVKN